MIDELYYDHFAESYVLKKDENAPPERYTLFLRGTGESYIESWYVDHVRSKCLNLNIMFNADEYNDPLLHQEVVKHMCEENRCKLVRLRYVVIPGEKFDEICESLSGKGEHDD